MSTIVADTIQHSSGSDFKISTASSHVLVYPRPGSAAYHSVSDGNFLPLNTIHKSLGTGTTDYDTSTYQYTAPVTGVYLVTLKTIVSGTTDQTNYGLCLDGSSTNEMIFGWGYEQRGRAGVTSIALTAGQTVGFKAIGTCYYYGHTSAMPTHDQYTFASYTLVGT